MRRLALTGEPVSLLASAAICLLGSPSAAAQAPPSRGGVVAGIVWGGAEPLAGVRVELSVSFSHPPIRRVETDSTGGFHFSGLAPASYELCAHRLGWVRQCYGRGRPEIVITAGEEVSADFDLESAAAVRGRVYDRDGQPEPGCYVFFDPRGEDSASYHVFTDRQGSFAVLDLPPGDYLVSARRFEPGAGRVVGPEWFYPGTADPARAAIVPLPAGEPVELEIRFGFDEPRGPEAGTLSARVIDSAGAPIPGVDLVVERVQDLRSEEWFAAAGGCRTADEGSCSMRLAPGRYWVRTRRVPSPYAPWRDPAPALGRPARRGKPVQVGQGGLSEVSFSLERGVTLEVRFQRPGGGLIDTDPGLAARLSSAVGLDPGFDSGSPPGHPFIQAIGGLVAGEPYPFQLLGHSPRKDFVVWGIEALDARLEPGRERPDLIITGERPRILVTLERAAQIRGRLGADDQVVAERIDPRPLPQSAYPRQSFISQAASGRFVLSGLPPGRYRLAIPGREPFVVELAPGQVYLVSSPSAADSIGDTSRP